MSLFPCHPVEHKGAEKQPGTRSCPTCAKTRPRPEAGGCRGLALPPCPSWCHICPHHPARGLHSKTRTRPNPPETDQGRKPRREDQSSTRGAERAPGQRGRDPWARCPRLLRVCLALHLCFTSGLCQGSRPRNGGWFVSRVQFPQRVFPCVYAFSTSSIRKKKMALVRFYIGRQLFYLMHS